MDHLDQPERPGLLRRLTLQLAGSLMFIGIGLIGCGIASLAAGVVVAVVYAACWFLLHVAERM